MVQADLFRSLKPFVWSKFREEGPPEFVRTELLGGAFHAEETSLSPTTKNLLELMTIGYRPATTLGILCILSQSPKVALHGMQIGKELERQFDVEEGWFSRTRYYTDRVGKLLTLLTRLEILQEVFRKDSKGSRTLAAYQIHASLAEPVKVRIEELSRGERISFFSTHPQPPREILVVPEEPLIINPRECIDCKVMVTSAIARYCEKCGKPLKLNCLSCKGRVDAIYNYCPMCGSKMDYS